MLGLDYALVGAVHRRRAVSRVSGGLSSLGAVKALGLDYALARAAQIGRRAVSRASGRLSLLRVVRVLGLGCALAGAAQIGRRAVSGASDGQSSLRVVMSQASTTPWLGPLK